MRGKTGKGRLSHVVKYVTDSVSIQVELYGLSLTLALILIARK